MQGLRYSLDHNSISCDFLSAGHIRLWWKLYRVILCTKCCCWSSWEPQPIPRSISAKTRGSRYCYTTPPGVLPHQNITGQSLWYGGLGTTNGWPKGRLLPQEIRAVTAEKIWKSLHTNPSILAHTDSKQHFSHLSHLASNVLYSSCPPTYYPSLGHMLTLRPQMTTNPP